MVEVFKSQGSIIDSPAGICTIEEGEWFDEEEGWSSSEEQSLYVKLKEVQKKSEDLEGVTGVRNDQKKMFRWSMKWYLKGDWG